MLNLSFFTKNNFFVKIKDYPRYKNIFLGILYLSIISVFILPNWWNPFYSLVYLLPFATFFGDVFGLILLIIITLFFTGYYQQITIIQKFSNRNFLLRVLLPIFGLILFFAAFSILNEINGWTTFNSLSIYFSVGKTGYNAHWTTFNLIALPTYNQFGIIIPFGIWLIGGWFSIISLLTTLLILVYLVFVSYFGRFNIFKIIFLSDNSLTDDAGIDLKNERRYQQLNLNQPIEEFNRLLQISDETEPPFLVEKFLVEDELALIRKQLIDDEATTLSKKQAEANNSSKTDENQKLLTEQEKTEQLISFKNEVNYHSNSLNNDEMFGEEANSDYLELPKLNSESESDENYEFEQKIT